MPMNRDYLGRTFPASEPYEVGREKIREFAEAIGDPNPAYHDRDAAQSLGHPDVVAPPTFLTVMSFRMGRDVVFDPGLGLDYSMVVHGEERFAFHRPVYAGDVLVGTPKITEIRDAGRNEVLTWQAEIATSDGEPVATVVTTLVARGTAAAQER